MRTIFILFFAFVSTAGFSQYPDENEIKQYPSDYDSGQYPILKDAVKKPGIYRTFEEFRSNNPSVSLQDKIVPVEDKYRSGTFSEPFIFTSYKLDMDKDAAKQLGAIYGFCDGEKIYVTSNPKDNARANRPSFHPMDYIGRYCVYDAIHVSSLDNLTFSSQGVFFMDMHTGYADLLTNGRLKRIIKGNKELAAEFKASEKNDKNLKDFLLRYLKATTK